MSPDLLICSRKKANEILARQNGGGPKEWCAVISINDVIDRPPYAVRKFVGPCLTLYMDDVEQDGSDIHGYVAPTRGDAEKIIAFAKRVHSPMIIHCAAGVSRSSAAALVVRAALNPEVPDDVIVAETLDPTWHWPNEKLIEFADKTLKRNLLGAVKAWKSGTKAAKNEERGND